MNWLRRSSAFSLVEVLVATAIVVLLAVILRPVFVPGKRAGERSVCLSNLRYLGRGVALYAVDHDGKNPRVPRAVSRHLAGGAHGAMTPLLRPKRGFETDLSRTMISQGVATRLWRCPPDQASPMYGHQSASWLAEIGSAYDDDVTAFGLAPEPSDPSRAALMMDIEAWGSGGSCRAAPPLSVPNGARIFSSTICVRPWT